MKSLTTQSGKAVHPIGIGTWGIASTINPANAASNYRGVELVRGNEDTEIEAIRYSISKGQNHLDCAELYGAFYTDEVVGQAIAGLKRENLFVADKLWKSSLARGKVRPTVELMFKKLGTDYLDLLYIHYPFDDAPWQEAIPQIDELIDQGRVRHFGVSNFTLEQLKEVQALARHPIAAVQQNFNVMYQDEANEQYRTFCETNGVALIAYQPLKRREVQSDSKVLDVAQKHSATPSQVALAWLIAVGALPIPKAVTKEHIDENLGALEIKLDEDDLAKLTRKSV